jgi:hypothetical protein
MAGVFVLLMPFGEDAARQIRIWDEEKRMESFRARSRFYLLGGAREWR